MDFKHCASYGLAFVNFLNFDRAEQLRRCFPQYARTCIPGCQRPVMVDAVPAQYKHTLIHGRVSMAFPAPTMSMRLTPQTRRPLRFKAALSESSTKCGIEDGLWNAALRLPEFCHHTLGNVLQNGLASWRSTCAVLHVAVDSGSTLVHGSASVSDRLWTLFYVGR